MAIDMGPSAPAPKYTFAERAAAHNLDDAQILNSNNVGGPEPPCDADIVVAGGGIHGLIYAIHAATKEGNTRSVSLIEKSSKPSYKIGESTLPVFSMWAKMNGLTAEYLLRIFGLKDGLAFYYMKEDELDHYTDNLLVGTPGNLLSGYQIERPISELLLTLLAQRKGINVYHGHKVDFNASKVEGGLHNNRINVSELAKGSTKAASNIQSSMLVDATGRFRQYTSKAARSERFDGFNTDAFWAYYDHPEDIESKTPFRHYEAPHTNHLCTPDGWFWVIRLITWQGNSTAKLMDMLTYLLDCAELGVPSDRLPSTAELASMFDLKWRWCTSIGIAARNDVKYPEDMSSYGSTEAERKLNYFIRKYPLIKDHMKNYTVIEDLYGPGTTWFVRKTLSYQSPLVTGPGWMAIGDACGFTNPLFSPGINVGMASSTIGADKTLEALDAAEGQPPQQAESTIRKVYEPYDKFVVDLIPHLNQMNHFQYNCFRDLRLGPQVSIAWQYYAAAMAGFDPVHINGTFTLNRNNYMKYIHNWAWGSMFPGYDVVAKKTIELIESIPLDQPVPDEVVRDVIAFSDKIMAETVAANPTRTLRWGGKIRSHDCGMVYREGKTGRDRFTSKCAECKAWTIRRPDWTKCHSCGKDRVVKDNVIIWDPPRPDMVAA